MIIEEKGLVKAIKAAYRHSGYTVLNQGGEVTIYTEGWFVRCLWTKLPRKALAIIVEHMGMIPDDGEAMAIEKDDQPQAVMAGIVSDDVAGWMGGEAASMASYVPVTFRGYQLFQEVNGRQAYGVDPTALAIVERATAEMGTAAISGGRALTWSHDGETVMLGAIRKPPGRGTGSGPCGRPWKAWTCTRRRADRDGVREDHRLPRHPGGVPGVPPLPGGSMGRRLSPGVLRQVRGGELRRLPT